LKEFNNQSGMRRITYKERKVLAKLILGV